MPQSRTGTQFPKFLVGHIVAGSFRPNQENTKAVWTAQVCVRTQDFPSSRLHVWKHICSTQTLFLEFLSTHYYYCIQTISLHAGRRGEGDVWGPSRLPLHKKTGRQADGEGREVQPRVNSLSSLFFPMTTADTTLAGCVINRPPELPQWPYSLHGGSNLKAIIHYCVRLKRPNRWAAPTHKRQWVYYPSGGVVHTITQAQ